jgi:hypothetical protein
VRAKAVHVLDRAATVIGTLRDILRFNCESVLHTINIFMIYTSSIYCYGREIFTGGGGDLMREARMRKRIIKFEQKFGL